MRKHWFAAVFAALLVVGAGTAIASIPSGSGTSFSVSDPAVTVIASGNGAEGGSYPTGTTFFTAGSESFTAAANGVCLVNVTGQVLRNTGEGAKVTYGIVEKVGGSEEFVGQHGITTTLGRFTEPNDAASLAKNELVSVEAGKTYSFGFGIEAVSGSGVVYPVENYVCFGG